MKEGIWFVVGAVVGAGIMWMALSEAPEGCGANANDVTLTLVRGSVPILANPDPACVEFPEGAQKGGRLHWTASGRAGDIIKIEFKNGSPFPQNYYEFTVAANGLGEKQSDEVTAAPTGPGTGDCKTPGEPDCYKYDVRWERAGSEPVVVDPMVKIRRFP